MKMPAIQFEPDGYLIDGPKLMGRQSAGNGFLRAAISAQEIESEENILFAWTPHKSSAEIFNETVNHYTSKLRTGWIPSNRYDLLDNHGSLYLPGPGLAAAARQRLRAGISAWSITGTTHTLCSHLAMDAIVDLISAPTMPWDALVCTSLAAKNAVQNLLRRQAEYLSWRFGVKTFSVPQLPVIPLGVHRRDFEFSVHDKPTARHSLEIRKTDVVILFSGRLSFHAKAHPYPMLVALQEAAKISGQNLVLLLCGQFPNEAVKSAFLQASSNYAPLVRTLWIDGKDSLAYNRAWAASDIFISLSDNLQETFGITPLEAMASGLPVIVTDWNGYKDTVVDGVTGFRIPTWMPQPDVGSALATAFEGGSINYDRYIGLACLEVSVNNEMLVSRLLTLISDPLLRAKMSAAGLDRVSKLYDWSIVIKQYQELWFQLDKIRREASVKNRDYLNIAPKCAPSRADPYRIFSSFPTQLIDANTTVQLSQAAGKDVSFSDLVAGPLFSYASGYLPSTQAVDSVLRMLRDGPMSVSTLARGIECTLIEMIRLLAPLAKIGFVIFDLPTEKS